MIDSLRNTYHPSFSLSLSFSPRFPRRVSFHVYTWTRASTGPRSTYPWTFSQHRNTRARALTRDICMVYDKYEIPSADYVLLSFAWVHSPSPLYRSRVVVPEKKGSRIVAVASAARLVSAIYRWSALPPQCRNSRIARILGSRRTCLRIEFHK